MKTKNISVSGTGNGVYEEYLPDFISALKDFEKLIRSIYKYYEKDQKKTFDGKFHLLNNWHNTYKIDLRPEEFPYHICNGISVYSGGWNHLQLVAKFPLKFKAPTFGGGETTNMNVALVTEVYLSEHSMNLFLNNKEIPESLKLEILRTLKDHYKNEIVRRYEKDVKYLKDQIAQKKDEIEESKTVIDLNTVEIPKIEKRIKEIESILVNS